MRRMFASALAFVVALSSAVAVVFATSSPAAAYKTINCSWSSSAVPYYVFPTSGVYNTEAFAAMAAWQNTPTPIYFVYKSDLDTEKEISIDDSGVFGSTGHDGESYWHCSGGHFQWAQSYWNTTYTNSYSTNGKLQVMVHELGHTLGLAHSGTSTCTHQPIMYPSSDRYYVCRHVNPQTDDVNGINALY